MTWIRDPRPGIAWRLKRARRRAGARVTRVRRRLPRALGGATRLNAKNRFRAAWGRYWYDRPVNPRVVLYESFAGNGALCNPRAIFDELLETDDMKHLRHVWCFANLTVKREFDKRFAPHPRVRSVLIGDLEYYKVLSTAKYLVNNSTFPPNFVKRDEQIYVNTWHGTPMKTMGYDSPEGAFGSRNIIRNLLAADYLLSPSEYTTEKLYEQGYRLRGIYRGTVIEEGYPRTDAQFLERSDVDDVRSELAERGVHVSGQKIVLFAPTWRGRSFSDPVYDVDDLCSEVESLAGHLGPDYTVLLKVHQQIFDSVSGHDPLRGRLVPNSIPTNRVLACVDVLVTDYSSIFFDFLATGRPVLFYIPDVRGYERDRGVVLDLSELPGPTYGKLSEVAVAVRALSTGSEEDPWITYADRYRAAAQKYCPADDGRVTARVIDIVFRSGGEGYRVRHGLPDGRTSILISAGHARTSGVITSLLGLLHNLDLGGYAVTLLVQAPRNEQERWLQELVPRSVRQLIRTGTFPVTKRRIRTHEWFLANGLNEDGTFPGDEERVLAAEWRHSLGMSRFDHAIDFSGYAPFWPAVLLQGDVGVRSIWLHNDMGSEAGREVHGKRFLHPGLRPTFTLYPRFDRLVSVSESLAGINASSLEHLAPPEKFTSARNTVDVDRILSMAAGTDVPGAADASDLPVAGVPLSTVAEELVRSYPRDLLGDEIARQVTLAELLPERGSTRTFVTAGRLSPEKNHARMIHAFARVHHEHPDARLLILGAGPLMNDLEGLVERLDLDGVVRLAGYRSNPYAVLAASDCFVLSSDYEGQPMVVLEALTVGLPVVSVDFGSAGDAMPNGGGLVVPQSVDGLVGGMRAFLRGEVSARDFDVQRYNAAAMAEFAAAIGEDS